MRRSSTVKKLFRMGESKIGENFDEYTKRQINFENTFIYFFKNTLGIFSFSSLSKLDVKDFLIPGASRMRTWSIKFMVTKFKRVTISEDETPRLVFATKEVLKKKEKQFYQSSI